MIKKLRVAPNQKLVASVVPGSVFRTPPFVFQPQAFVAESERLNERIFSEDLQVQGLNDFKEDPRTPLIYVVSGNPDDGQARLFAALLVNIHMTAHKGHSVEWHSVHGGFNNPLVKEERDSPSMIVLTNLSPNSTQVKLDKVRDICEKWDNVPRVLVVAGEDPISFMATRLYLPCNAMAYFCDSMMKKRVEVL